MFNFFRKKEKKPGKDEKPMEEPMEPILLEKVTGEQKPDEPILLEKVPGEEKLEEPQLLGWEYLKTLEERGNVFDVYAGIVPKSTYPEMPESYMEVCGTLDG
jgi:hypothetical protein